MVFALLLPTIARGESALAEIVQEHPRLFIRKADVQRIQETIETLPEAKSQWDIMVRETDPARPVRYPEAGQPTQPEWMRATIQEGQFAARCGFLYQMTGDVRYADRAKSMLLGYAKEFDTKVNFELCGDFHTIEAGHVGASGNVMGFYFSGHLLMNAAMAYDCVYETLTADERQTIEQNFFRKYIAVIESFDYSKRLPMRAPDFMVNGGQWNGANVCNMGLTAAGFVLNDRRLYERGVRNFKLQLGRDMLADGFWVEEDREYADTCMMTLFNIAWMAKSSGYAEDLFQTVVQALPAKDYDRRYANTLVSQDGSFIGSRSLSMYLDAPLDYQYPNFADGDWGWAPNRGSIKQSADLVGMYTLGYAVYGKPAYAFALQNVDRSQAWLGSGVTSLFYYGKAIPNVPPMDTHSRVYSHGRWVALKSIEGPSYWNSDSLYAFMPYGTERNKGVQPLTLDIFGFGKTLAPRVGMQFQAQLLTGDYQLTEPAWNGVMTDGHNPSFFRDQAERSWMAWQDLGPLIKVVSPRIHYLGSRRSELYQPDCERHPEEDRVISRTLALTDRYLVDVVHITYDQPPKYKHNFDYILHGYGKLKLEGLKGDDDVSSDTTAVWKQDDGIGLRSTVLSGMPRTGTKFKTYVHEPTEVLVASRVSLEETFIVLHEPVKGASRLAGIIRLADDSDHVALEVRHQDGTVDFLALRLSDNKTSFSITRSGGKIEELKGNYLYLRVKPDGQEERQEQ